MCYYDSRTGTFCSADPLAGEPSDPQSWNRYAYGRNDPIDITDPSGQSWWTSLLIDAGVAVAMYFLGPEIQSFLSIGGGSPGFIATPEGSMMPGTFTPTLVTRGAAQAVAEGAGDAAGAASASGLSWSLAGAAAAEATDQPNSPQQGHGTTLNPQLNHTQDCINKGLKSNFNGDNPTVGSQTQEVGGHWNYNVQLNFSSTQDTQNFWNTYNASANSGWGPPARFGPGPALHLENVSPNGPFSVTGTAHLDLGNPDTGIGGLIVHSAVDGLWGHIAQMFHRNIDYSVKCPFH